MNEIDCINQAIGEIAEELFKTCETPEPEHLAAAVDEVYCLMKRREALYYARRRGA